MTASTNISKFSSNPGDLHSRSRGASASSATSGRGAETSAAATGEVGASEEAGRGESVSVSTVSVHYDGFNYLYAARILYLSEARGPSCCSPCSATWNSAKEVCPSSPLTG